MTLPRACARAMTPAPSTGASFSRHPHDRLRKPTACATRTQPLCIPTGMGTSPLPLLRFPHSTMLRRTISSIFTPIRMATADTVEQASPAPLEQASPTVTPTDRVKSRLLLLTAPCILGMVLAASSCSTTPTSTLHHSPAPTPLRTHTKAPSPSSAPLLQPQASPTQSASCTTPQLEASILDKSGAAGTIYAAVSLTNTTGEGCSISGYPKIAAISAAGADVQLQENSTAGPLSPFAIYGAFPLIADLPPHGEGAVVLAYTDSPVGNAACVQIAKLVISPPSGNGTLLVPFPATLCSTTVSVSPVKSGISFLSP